MSANHYIAVLLLISSILGLCSCNPETAVQTAEKTYLDVYRNGESINNKYRYEYTYECIYNPFYKNSYACPGALAEQHNSKLKKLKQFDPNLDIDSLENEDQIINAFVNILVKNPQIATQIPLFFDDSNRFKGILASGSDIEIISSEVSGGVYTSGNLHLKKGCRITEDNSYILNTLSVSGNPIYHYTQVLNISSIPQSMQLSQYQEVALPNELQNASFAQLQGTPHIWNYAVHK